VDRDEIVGRFEVAFDLLSQLGDVHVDRAAQRQAFVPPDAVQQLIARHDLTSVVNEEFDDLEFARGEVDLPTISGRRHAFEIDDDLTERIEW
jgi:hypothetical protein